MWKNSRQDRRCDIGLSSRYLKEEEKAQGLTETVLAFDGIFVIVANFESVTETKDACKYRQELTSADDVVTTVAGNSGAIGYVSLASANETVKVLAVDGVMPTNETLKDGSYTVQRPFVLVTKTDTALSETAQNFFDYITSIDANEIISSAGVVPAN